MEHDGDIWNLKLVIRYCEDIADDIRRFGDDIEDLLGDSAYQRCTAKSLELIGETIKRLSPELTSEFNDVPWHEICKMRDFMAHQYENIERTIQWSTMTEDIPILRERCGQILAILESRADNGSM